MSTRDALRGFDSLRTRPSVAPAAQPEKRRCESCGAVLRADNSRAACAPCTRGETDLPAWAVVMAEGMNKGELGALANMLRAAMRIEAAEPVDDPEAPRCACGCGLPTQRSIQSNHGNPRRSGPYQRYLVGHQSRMRRTE